MQPQPQSSYVHGANDVPLIGVTIGACIHKHLLQKKVARDLNLSTE